VCFGGGRDAAVMSGNFLLVWRYIVKLSKWKSCVDKGAFDASETFSSPVFEEGVRAGFGGF